MRTFKNFIDIIRELLTLVLFAVWIFLGCVLLVLGGPFYREHVDTALRVHYGGEK